MSLDKEAVMRGLREIPSMNENTAEALWSLGIRSVEDLKGRDPTAIYEELRNKKGSYAEPCMLNILKIAIHYASKNR
ncbi:MAG: helix-hairpin-helix domain-containing protein [Methanomassiliicoccales archaeon]|nr:helix-hairpin-helix domain-containing protein [Methanomassiliicoccales archaeon]